MHLSRYAIDLSACVGDKEWVFGGGKENSIFIQMKVNRQLIVV
jgi:hypothetical protein